jgi:hypothetical protein
VKDYQYLDHDYREEVQLPLNDSSWPHYGSIFTYVHVQLVILKSNLDYVIQLGRAVWERHGQDARLIDVFNLKTGVRMLDLISALQEFVEAKPKPVKLRR